MKDMELTISFILLIITRSIISTMAFRLFFRYNILSSSKNLCMSRSIKMRTKIMLKEFICINCFFLPNRVQSDIINNAFMII